MIPSFRLPFPRIAIFVRVSVCMRFWVLPRGPMIRPMKLKKCRRKEGKKARMRAQSNCIMILKVIPCIPS